MVYFYKKYLINTANPARFKHLNTECLKTRFYRSKESKE